MYSLCSLYAPNKTARHAFFIQTRFQTFKGSEVTGHHRTFRPKKKDVTSTPIEKKISKKGASSNIVNIDEERNLVLDIEDCRSFIETHVWSHGVGSRVPNVLRSADRAQT